MDMFQKPTLLEDPHDETDIKVSMLKSAPSAPFTIFQDDNKDNSRAVAERQNAVRALAEIPVSKTDKSNETPQDQIPDESTMWGARFNSLHSLAACPNSTTEFALQAHLVSTPSTHKTLLGNMFVPDREEDCYDREPADNLFIRRHSKKLSPIIEQSPLDDKLSDTSCSPLVPSSAQHGTIIGEALATAQDCMVTSSVTMVLAPPPAVLSFREQTLCSADPALGAATSVPCSNIYVNQDQQPPKPIKSEHYQIFEEGSAPPSCPEQAQRPAADVPMSPDRPLTVDWMVIMNPEVAVEQDLNAFPSPCRPKMAATVAIIQTQDVPMSPEQPALCPDVPMSPAPHQQSCCQEEAVSPDRGRSSADISVMKESSAPLVPDPWDEQLIFDLLSSLTPPLTSHPRYITWQCNIPSIAPKMTISMGKASLRVDCVLGQGAFATIYQATDPTSSEKIVLKVQKPANTWEFYIHTQLDARLQPDIRRLFGTVHSAHLFNNGSILLGELHNYGTLLNAVNIYKGLGDKVMPQPLVMYFAVCILHMVEQLHAVNIVHADIKPDNFLLGERFLENKCFESENVDHGLVLIDMGQSIDLERFPPGSAFTAKCLTSGFQCTEMQSGKPWNYQTDYFGIVGTIYCLLFGTYMKVINEGGVWKTNAIFRRNPHSVLWLQLFEVLLNVPDCSRLPSLRLLRQQLTSVLQQNYSNKLSSLKNRLVVMLLENRMR